MFRKLSKPTEPPQWLIVGLGNPGAEYNNTRHNVGFEVIDRLAEGNRIKLDRSKHMARFGVGRVGETTVVLVKPLTYMNLSGRAVAPLAREYGLKPDRVLVIADDLALRLGRLRLKPGGGAGGHNGHKSLIHSLGTEEYPRLKVGIGSAQGQTIDFVLGKFERDEIDTIRLAIQNAADGVQTVVQYGIEAGMNQINLG